MYKYTDWRNLKAWGFSESDVFESRILNGQIGNKNGPIWWPNCVAASKYELPWISELYGMWSGPCLVCGAGPSLLRNVEHVKKAKEKGWGIIATDRALSTLRSAGIHEDFSVTTECQPECGGFLEAAQAGDMVVVNLISCESTRKALVERGCAVYHCACMSPMNGFWDMVWKELYNGIDHSCIRPNLVVTHAATDIAFWMGYDVVIIGNDLCYESAEECAADTGELSDGGSGYIRRLKDGRWTYTIFEIAASGFGLLPQWHPDRTFIDCSNGISHLPRMDLKDLLGAGELPPPALLYAGGNSQQQ